MKLQLTLYILLWYLISDASITQKQLKEIINISEPNISKRVKNLEEKKIIRDYFIDFDLTQSEDFINFYCFIDCNERSKNIFSCFCQIPYFIMIHIESSTKFCFQMRLNAKDLKKFLKGFDLLRPYLKSYFFQFVYDQVKENPQYLFDFFNRMTRKWETPIEDYISLMEKE